MYDVGRQTPLMWVDLGGEGGGFGWDQEDKLAVEEAEQFDDIAVMGYQAVAQEQRQYSQKNPVVSTESKRKERRG